MATVALPLLTPDLLDQMTEAIVQAVAPEQVVLFGSQARGSAGPHSDNAPPTHREFLRGWVCARYTYSKSIPDSILTYTDTLVPLSPPQH